MVRENVLQKSKREKYKTISCDSLLEMQKKNKNRKCAFYVSFNLNIIRII